MNIDTAPLKKNEFPIPLNEGRIDGSTVRCPWHGSEFKVCTGAVLRGPARDPLKTYTVTVEGGVGRIDGPLA